MRSLVTGGAGYIGSHTAIELAAAGHEVVLLDNLSNASLAGVEAVRRLAGTDIGFVQCDLRDRDGLARVFAGERFDAVFHFAALKAVGESAAEPLRYYDNNVGGTLALLEEMAAHGVRTLVFSSSASVYGNPATMPITEDTPPDPQSPYARTKLAVEHLLRDLHAADPGWRIAILRYFNAVGAHPSGETRRESDRHPRQSAALRRAGRGWTARPPRRVRQRLPHPGRHRRARLRPRGRSRPRPCCGVAGTRRRRRRTGLQPRHRSGQQASWKCYAPSSAASGRRIPYEFVGRRPGDVAVSRADPTKARTANSAGPPTAASTGSAKTFGAGSRPIRMASAAHESKIRPRFPTRRGG